MQVAVCVITYRRREGLTRLLEGLNGLTFREDSPDIRVVIVDNYEADSARDVCDRVRPGFRWSLECYVEPRRGIPYARNTAIARAGEEADFVAFIDDDEVPEPDWLDELLRVQRQYQADVVTGPVPPRYTDQTPHWLIKGRFLERPRFPTGHRLEFAFTGNVLITREVLSAMDALFDEQMAMTGGSDKEFFARVFRAGRGIVWADDAVAYETIPASRATAQWIYQRAYRYGNATSLIAGDGWQSVGRRAKLLAIACYRIIKGGVGFPFGMAMGRHVRVACVRHLYYGAGMLTGLFGHRYDEYTVREEASATHKESAAATPALSPSNESERC